MCCATRCCSPRAGTRPRATICMHLAPTASRRVYQQRVGRVTRRNPGKEAGLVIDFVHPATTHDETIVTLHSLLDRDVYRGGAIVVGPVRRGRGRRVRVEKRVVPVSDDSNRRLRVLERELWRIAVENLNHSEQHVWAALAGARVNPSGWRRAKAMLQHDTTKELRRRFLLTCVQRNRNQQLRIKALAEIAALRDADAFDDAIDTVGTWSRDDRRAGTKVLLEALAERRIGRRDQAQAWVWRLAEYTRDLHEEYAVQRWPETKRLLGLLVNSSGRRPRPQRTPAGPRRPQPGPPPGRRPARRRSRPHARGRGGSARSADARRPQAVRRRPRAASQLPEGRRTPSPSQAQGLIPGWGLRREERQGRGGDGRGRARATSETRGSRSTTSRSPTATTAPRPRPTRSWRPPRRPTRADSPLHGEVDLTRAQRQSLSVVPLDQQVAVLVDFLDHALAAVPGDPFARERVPGAVGSSGPRRRRSLEPAAE